MSLSDEQRAMLQLLLEGGEGYEDLATLLAAPAQEIRRRAADALDAVSGGEIGSDGALADYLLGQATASELEATRTGLSDDPDRLAKARRLHARLRLLYPGANLPDLPSPSQIAAPPAPTPPRPASPPKTKSEAAVGHVAAPTVAPTETDEPEADEPAGDESASAEALPESRPAAPEPAEPQPAKRAETEQELPAQVTAAEPTLSPQQKRLLAALVGTGLVIVVIVLAVTGVFAGDDSSSDANDSATTTAQSDAADDETALTRAVLAPQGGGKGAGVAIFGAVDEETPVLQVTARNLPASKQGEEYSVWLYNTDQIALRLAGVEVGRNGRIATQIELPPEALNFIVDGTLNQVDISRNRKPAYRQEMRAAQEEQRLPRRIGTSVLRGQITGPGLAAASGQ